MEPACRTTWARVETPKRPTPYNLAGKDYESEALIIRLTDLAMYGCMNAGKGANSRITPNVNSKNVPPFAWGLIIYEGHAYQAHTGSHRAGFLIPA